MPGIDDGYYDQYVRDPEDLFGELLADTFVADGDLPSDAEFSGYSTSRLRLWIAPSVSTAVFVEVLTRFERWPRVGPDPILCA